MEEIKNKIITLSGEPVSGKGTVAKALKQKLIQEGYEPEKIHMKSTGDEFRKYFTSVVELIINFDNPKREEIARRPEIKALFENAENRKVISKTIASLAEKKIDLSHFTIEDANNSPEFEDIRSVIDHTIDEAMKKEGVIVKNTAEAIQGAKDIIAEMVSDEPKFRAWIRLYKHHSSGILFCIVLFLCTLIQLHFRRILIQPVHIKKAYDKVILLVQVGFYQF